MAKIKLGAFVTEISGKVGGSIFARNRGGAYVKNRVMPSNPRTAFQATVRALFATISSAWRDLTEAQRVTWNKATDNYPIIDKLGDSRLLSGSQLHQKLNLNLANVNLAFLSAPLQPEGARGNLFDTAPITSASILLSLHNVETDTPVEIFSTAGQSAGVSNVTNKYRKIGVITASDFVENHELIDLYTAKFGAPVVGSKIGIAIRSVNPNTGEASTQNGKVKIVG